jgi:glycine/D-amino acid oxidase-like deaminating enzyme
MQKYRCLIVGSGISGSFLSYYLYKRGIRFCVIDNFNDDTASNIGTAVINPVTGRRFATSWLYNEVFPFAVQAYKELEIFLKDDFITETNIVTAFTSLQMRQAFADRVEEGNEHVAWANQAGYEEIVNNTNGFGVIKPCAIVQITKIVNKWKHFLKENELLKLKQFNEDELEIGQTVKYQNLEADYIIYCNGVAAGQSKYFKILPFAPNKGEFFILEYPNNWPKNLMVKAGGLLVPSPHLGNNQFWYGSSYAWQYEDEQPTQANNQLFKQQLQQTLKQPFTVLKHKVAIRPATLERRPFVGFHPLQPKMGILNGMGSKGSSLAPFFAKQLVDNLVAKKPIYLEASIERFKKIFERNS